LADNIIILFFGRILGGVSATLLYSVFESWMVTEFNRVLPDEPGSTISGIFSTMTTLNSVVAVTAGMLAEWVVRMTGTAKSPFMTSIIFMAAAFVLMLKNWSENYGWHTGSVEAGDANPLLGEKVETKPIVQKSASKSPLRLAFEGIAS
jgi:MFS family permease